MSDLVGNPEDQFSLIAAHIISNISSSKNPEEAELEDTLNQVVSIV